MQDTNDDDINTEELQIYPHVTKSDDEYTYRYKFARMQYITFSAWEHNRNVKFSIASSVKEDEDADDKILDSVDLSRENYLRLRNFINHPEVMRRFGL